MKVSRLAIPDVCLIEPAVYGDARGFFQVLWNDADFRRDVCDVTFVQDNQSRSSYATLRGLHFQTRHTQGKLVRCSAGCIWDVAVDMRATSPTRGKWVGVELSEENHRQLWIPAGFAHGFVVRSESADLQYKVTDQYDPSSECTLRWDDPEVAIDWGLSAGVSPLLSAKDAVGMDFASLPGLP